MHIDMTHIHRMTLLALASVLAFSGCDRDKIEDYTVPTTYNFENVSYAGQTDRLNMLTEMSTYMKTANTPGVVLDAQRLRDMFENTNAPFSFSSTRQLKDKCFLADQATFDGYFDAIAVASQSTVPGSNGVAGVVYSQDSSKKYLFDAQGREHIQLIEKGLAGAVFYYQATAVYLSDARIGEGQADNETVTPGEGTEMEHHWDEAFGYFGVPKDFPANTTGLLFHGKYCNDRNTLLGTNKAVMDAFLKGRAAISHDDHTVKIDQVKLVRDNWERVLVGTAIHYINEAKADFADDALRNHTLSEAVAFMTSLRYNPTRRISEAQLQSALDAIGDNFYEVSLASLDTARGILSTAYGLDAVKDQL
jgi:Domain of unknown function (DUF4856)